MKINKAIVAAFAAITLAGGTAATAVAAGNTATPQAPSTTQIASETIKATQDNSERRERAGKNERDGKGERGERSGKRGMKGHKGHQKLAEALGVTPEELKDARKADKSIAELAAEKGISTSDLVNKLKAAAKKRLDKAVADGKITQEQADTRLAKLTENAEKRLTMKPSERPNKGEHGERAGKRGGMKGHKGHHKIAEALGVTPEELKDARKADKSIAELAAEKGISTSDLVNKLKADAKERLDKAVADGKITQEQADTRLAKLTENAEKRLTMKPSERPHKGERPGKGERGGKWAMKGDRNQAGPGGDGLRQFRPVEPTSQNA